MVWLVIGLLLLLLFWLLFSPIILATDTRIPAADIRWRSIAHLRIWYEDEWWGSMRIFFYRKTIRMAEMGRKRQRKSQPSAPRKTKKRNKPVDWLSRLRRVWRALCVKEWKLAIDSGDYVRNGQLYPLNFMPGLYQHLDINFRDENYLVCRITTTPWKLIVAFVR